MFTETQFEQILCAIVAAGLVANWKSKRDDNEVADLSRGVVDAILGKTKRDTKNLISTTHGIQRKSKTSA